MGAIISYFGHSRSRQPQKPTASISIVKLLDRELRILRAQNAEKDIVIRYLLHASITSISSQRDSQTKNEAPTEDLIDLSDCSQESDSTKVAEDDTTLLDESSIGEVQNDAPDSSVNQSSSELEGSSYTVHFVNHDKEFPEKYSQPVTLVPERDGSVVLAGKEILKQVGPHFRVPSMLHDLPKKVNSTTIEPQWVISETFCPIGERESAEYLSRRHEGSYRLRYPGFFMYGLRFCPSDKERDVYRTVIVSNLSPDIQLGTLLTFVRGGPVVDAKLLHTVQITGKNSALIIFLSEYAAMAFEDWTISNPVIINGVEVRVQVVTTPTWPTKLNLRKAMLDNQHTRCLRIFNFPQIPLCKFLADLDARIDIKYDRITYMRKTCNVLDLHFSSVEWAAYACSMFPSLKTYQNCRPVFVPDPCAQPVEMFEGQRMACIAGVERAPRHDATSRAQPAADKNYGRLSTVEWDCDAENRHGRGFEM